MNKHLYINEINLVIQFEELPVVLKVVDVVIRLS